MTTTILEHPVFRPLPAGPIPWPSDDELAWLAGFVDGEGTITLTVHGRARFILTTFSLTNTNLDSLGRARVLLRALTARDLMPHLTRNEGRPAFSLAINRHRDVQLVVNALRAHLVGKRPQADLMLAYLAECSAALNGTHRHVIDSPELKARRLEYARQMQELNRRYRSGEWAQLHPDMTIDVEAIASRWRVGQDAAVRDAWEPIKTLLSLRGD